MEKPVDSYETFRNALREALAQVPAEHAPSFGPDIAVAAFDELLSLKEKETLANDALLAGEIIERLNMLIMDGDVCADIARLIETRVPCSTKTLAHPSIQANAGPDSPRVGFLGVLNGIVGTIHVGSKKGYGYISAKFDGPDDAELVGFSPTVSLERQS